MGIVTIQVTIFKEHVSKQHSFYERHSSVSVFMVGKQKEINLSKLWQYSVMWGWYRRNNKWVDSGRLKRKQKRTIQSNRILTCVCKQVKKYAGCITLFISWCNNGVTRYCAVCDLAFQHDHCCSNKLWKSKKKILFQRKILTNIP